MAWYLVKHRDSCIFTFIGKIYPLLYIHIFSNWVLFEVLVVK